ncbi:phage protein NinX family protein, partial [Morganella sp. EGD-HP17]|uniref:phage protein NinX family protein n=1 Tax=Morganella sp. EGD-HP17 TaxID=1435146 RepID=UPI00044AD679
MNKYRDKSDFEINKAVAYHYLKGKDFSETTCRFFSDHVNDKFDPCNNPADAMPIVIANKISILHKKNDGTWYAYHPFQSVEHENFYRAAME